MKENDIIKIYDMNKGLKIIIRAGMAFVLLYFILVSLNILLDTWVFTPWNVVDLFNGITFACTFGFGIPIWVVTIVLIAILAAIYWGLYEVCEYLTRRWK